MNRHLNVRKTASHAMLLLVSITALLLTAGISFAALNCNQCHDNPPKDNSRDSGTGISFFTGNHNKHVFDAVNTVNNPVALNVCTKCHGAGVNTYTSAHSAYTSASMMSPYINTASKLDGYSAAHGRARYNKGTFNPNKQTLFFNQTSIPALATCSTVDCHFERKTPAWGSAVLFTANTDCNRCHGVPPSGVPNANPLMDYTGGAAGSHVKHNQYYSGVTIGCVKCHSDHTAETNKFAHATSGRNGHNLVVTLTTPKNQIETGTYSRIPVYPSYYPSAAGTVTFGTCNTIYCHSDGTKSSGSYTKVGAAPQWSATPFSTSNPNCDACHGGTFAAGAAKITNGKHGLHVNNTASIIGRNLGCQECHYATTNDGSTVATLANHVNGLVNIQFNPALSPDTDNPAYNNNSSAKASSGGAKKTPGNSAANDICANVYCHSDGKTNVATPTYRNVKWSDLAWTGGKQCTYCHGTQLFKAHNTDAGSSHARHVESDTAYGYSCGLCHANTTTDTNVYPSLPLTVSTGGSHLGRSETVRFSTGIAPATGNFTNMTGSYKLPITSKTCSSNVYCHSSGQDVAGSRPPKKVAIWGNGRMYCQDCHGGDANHGANVISTGLHRNHLDPTLNASLGTGNMLMCAQCHAKTVGFANNTTVTNRSMHVNKFIDYSGQFARGSAMYNNVTKTCSTLYCHSNGKIGTTVNTYANPAAWNSGTANKKCNYCHGTQAQGTIDVSNSIFTALSSLGAPNYSNAGGAGSDTANSHSKHVQGAVGSVTSLVCYTCHRRTLDSTTAAAAKFRSYSTTHVSGATNVAFSPAMGTPTIYNNSVGQKNCTNVYCHGSATIQWGANGSTNCNSCHSADSTLLGKHNSHIGTGSPSPATVSFMTVPANNSLDTVYNFSCSSCHSSTGGALHAGGAVSTNQTAQVFFGFTSNNRKGLYTAGTLVTTDRNFPFTAGTVGTCSTTYCHSDGNGGGPKITTFTWNSPINTLRCNGCHGSQDWKKSTAQPAYSSIRTQAHSRHVRGDINTELNKGNGIDCYRCHGATVSAAMNSYSTVGAGVQNKKRHVNKMRDYSGVSNNPNGAGTLSDGQFNSNAHVCSNVYCHSNSKIGISNGGGNIGYAKDPDAWNSGAANKKCNYCHGSNTLTTQQDTDATFILYSSTGVPNYVSGTAGSTAANSHRSHVKALGSTNYSDTNQCYTCHSATLDSTTGVSNTAAKFRPYSSRHTSGVYNVKMKPSIGGIYNGTVGTKTCGTSKCHGTISPRWGANNYTMYTCTKCHGTLTLTTGFSLANENVIAPPTSVAGTFGILSGVGRVSNDVKVGAHQTHLLFSNGLSAVGTIDSRCQNCHGPLPTSGAHANGNSTPTFFGLATTHPLARTYPSYNTVNRTCSNTYCHNPAGAGVLKANNAGTNIFPSWTGSKYISGTTRKTFANCSQCHKVPGDPTWDVTAFNHGTTTINNTCIDCHGHEGDTQGTAGKLHMDGIKYGSGNCDSCHGYDVGTWSAKAERSAVPEGKGAHEKHIAYLKTRYGVILTPGANQFGADYAGSNGSWTNMCGICHNGATHSTSEAIPGTGRTISISTTYQFGASAPVYNAATWIGTSSSIHPKTCSNISCHYFTSPVWSTY